jgi:hypothetical protein
MNWRESAKMDTQHLAASASGMPRQGYSALTRGKDMLPVLTRGKVMVPHDINSRDGSSKLSQIRAMPRQSYASKPGKVMG